MPAYHSIHFDLSSLVWFWVSTVFLNAAPVSWRRSWRWPPLCQVHAVQVGGQPRQRPPGLGVSGFLPMPVWPLLVPGPLGGGRQLPQPRSPAGHPSTWKREPLFLLLGADVTYSYLVSPQREKSWQEGQRVLATHPRSLHAVSQ